MKMNKIKFLAYLLIFTLISSCSNNPTGEKKYNDLSEKNYEHISDTVDGETIYFKTARTAYTPQDFTNLDDSQKLFIKHCLEAADTIIRKHQPNSSIDNFNLNTLDSLIDQWNDNNVKFDCSEEYFINTIGAAFGHFLIKEYKMKWTIVTDEYGSDYATTIEEIKLRNFPLNSVAKAIDEKRKGSLHTISLMSKRRIEELKKANE